MTRWETRSQKEQQGGRQGPRKSDKTGDKLPEQEREQAPKQEQEQARKQDWDRRQGWTSCCVTRKGKENSGIGGMDIYLYVPNIKTPTRQIHANIQSQVTRRFYPNSTFPMTAKQDTRMGNHTMGQQGISEDTYGLTMAPRKRLGSISPIPFSRIHSVGIGGQGFRDIKGSRSCPNAGTRQMLTLASGILPVAIVGLQGWGCYCWHWRTGITELLTNHGTGTWSVTRRRSRRSGYRVGYKKPWTGYQSSY